MKNLPMLLLLLTFALCSCNKSLEPPNVTTYTFATGTVWTYRVESSINHFRPIRDSVTFRDTSYTWTGEVRAMGDTVLHDSVKTSRVSARENLSGVQPSENFYILRHDTLYLYAWTFGGSSPILPKMRPGYLFSHNGYAYHSAEELFESFRQQRMFGLPSIAESLYYSPSPPRVLVFPLHTGLTWTFNSIDSIEIKKKITGTESLTTDAGVFSTYVIQWSGAFFDSIITEKEYMSDLGLVKRTFTAHDVTISSELYPDGFGIVDLKIEYVLTSLKTP